MYLFDVLLSSMILSAILSSLCIILISNSTYKEFRATAMGLGQMVAGLFRFLVRFEVSRDV